MILISKIVIDEKLYESILCIMLDIKFRTLQNREKVKHELRVQIYEL